MAVARRSELEKPLTREETPRSVRILIPGGKDLNIPLTLEDDREFAVLIINGIRYHLERVPKEELTTNYKVDLDPDYEPQGDATGHCYMLVPFSK